MDPRFYRTLLLLLAVGLVLWAFGLILQPFLVSVAWAMCFVALTLRPYRALAKSWGKPRLAAATMTIATGIGIVVPLLMLVLLLLQEATHLSHESVGDLANRLREATPNAYAKANEFLARFDTSIETLGRDAGRAAAGILPKIAANVVGGLASSVIGLLVMLGTQYFLYRDASSLTSFVRDVLPLPEQDTDLILTTLHKTTVAAIVGGLATALIQGAIGGVGLALAGVPGAVTWGVVMAAASFLPVGGTAIVWGPIAIWLFATGRTGAAWFLVAWGGVVLSLSDNFIRPYLLKRGGAAKIHPLLLLFAVVSGVGIFGPSGIVFGPLLIAFLTTVATIYREHVAPGVRSVRPPA
jgi:predicted PurR-regulated permease PerM